MLTGIRATRSKGAAAAARTVQEDRNMQTAGGWEMRLGLSRVDEDQTGTVRIITAEGSCGVSLYQPEVQSVGMKHERQWWNTEHSRPSSQEDRAEEEKQRTEDDVFPRA